MGGYLVKILRVDMTELKTHRQEVPEEYRYLGGRAITSRIIYNRVPAASHPLSPENKLVLAGGLLTGTSAPSSGRLSLGAKSPLTGTIKEANGGGISGQKLANLGWKALIIEGKPQSKELFLLRLREEGEELVPAGDLTGLGTYELCDRLWERYGKHIGIISIGPAGEMLFRNAGIFTTDREGQPVPYTGRGGLGAVMGAKGLKAIILDTKKTFEVRVRDVARFRYAAKKFARALLTRFEQVNGLSCGQLAALVNERGGKGKTGYDCDPGCITGYSNIYLNEQGEVLCAPIAYESAWALGANCAISDLDTAARLNRLCNDLGLDTIEAGCTLGVAMEAGILEYGDGEKAIKLLEEIGQGTHLGRILGQGAQFTGKAFGVTRVPAVKGQGIPTYVSRAVKVNSSLSEGQVNISPNLQLVTAALDSTGLCLFVAFALLDAPNGLPIVTEMINAQYGLRLTVEDLLSLGQEVLQMEGAFNKAAGDTKSHDPLPDFFYRDRPDPHRVVLDVPDAELAQVLDFEVETD